MPITPDDDLDNDDLDNNELETPEAPPHSFSEMVRESPIGAVVGAFVAGFLVSRLL